MTAQSLPLGRAVSSVLTVHPRWYLPPCASRHRGIIPRGNSKSTECQQMALQNTQHHPSSCCWAAKGPTSLPASQGNSGQGSKRHHWKCSKQKGLWDVSHESPSAASVALRRAPPSGSSTAERSPAPLRRVLRTKVTTAGCAELQQAARAGTAKKT